MRERCNYCGKKRKLTPIAFSKQCKKCKKRLIKLLRKEL